MWCLFRPTHAHLLLFHVLLVILKPYTLMPYQELLSILFLLEIKFRLFLYAFNMQNCNAYLEIFIEEVLVLRLAIWGFRRFLVIFSCTIRFWIFVMWFQIEIFWAEWLSNLFRFPFLAGEDNYKLRVNTRDRISVKLFL